MIKDILANSQVRFGQKFPNKIAEVVDNFGSTIKNDIQNFLLQEQIAVVKIIIDEILSMKYKPHDSGYHFILADTVEVYKRKIISELEESIK